MFIISKRPELIATECALPYAKSYDLPIAPIPEEKLAMLMAGLVDPSLAPKIGDRNDLFKSDCLPYEIGCCVIPDDTSFLANRTEMLGAIPEMFEWWFAWHSLEDLRYHIWDPEDHYYARQQMWEKTLDQSLPMQEHVWGTVHHVLEDIGPGLDELVSKLRYPHELGYGEEEVGTNACATLVYANGHGPVPGQGVAAIMTHFVREIPGGIELRSRFWVGYGLVGGRLVKLVSDGVFVPEEVPMGLSAHNLKEFGYLVAIPPQVYAENKDNQ